MRKLFALLFICGLFVFFACSSTPETPEEIAQDKVDKINTRYQFKKIVKDLKPGMTTAEADSVIRLNNSSNPIIFCTSYFDGENCTWTYGWRERPDFILRFNDDTLVSKTWHEKL